MMLSNTGTFVISLDFELMWGVRDHRSVANYGDAVLGGRKAIPLILKIFQKAGIRATWATVGLLFAKSRKEMLYYAPTIKPNYQDPNLSPYVDIQNSLIGENEESDPLHFGASLIEKIASCPGQEIATHTYSHFYCLEKGATPEAFQYDLLAAKAIGDQAGYTMRSIIFPRNQKSLEFIAIVRDNELETFRGNAQGYMYQPRSGDRTNILFRTTRFLDGALPLGPKQIHSISGIDVLKNIPASRFLRPWSKKLGVYNHLYLQRILKEMELAAKNRKCFHLWWHPHNFGRNTRENIIQLTKIINHFEHLKHKYGMKSLNMSDFSTNCPERRFL
jgi:hypothetical protein